jgi:hypothetical protein
MDQPPCDLTLPNGDQMSAEEVEILHEEAWAAFGEAQRKGITGARLRALEARVSLLNKVKLGGFGPDAAMYRDADAHPSSRGPAAPHPLDAEIAKTRKAWMAAEREGKATQAQALASTLEGLYQRRSSAEQPPVHNGGLRRRRHPLDAIRSLKKRARERMRNVSFQLIRNI